MNNFPSKLNFIPNNINHQLRTTQQRTEITTNFHEWEPEKNYEKAKTNIILVIDFSLFKTQLLHNERIIIINFSNYPATPLSSVDCSRRLAELGLQRSPRSLVVAIRSLLALSSSTLRPDSNKFINFVFVFFPSR